MLDETIQCKFAIFLGYEVEDSCFFSFYKMKQKKNYIFNLNIPKIWQSLKRIAVELRLVLLFLKSSQAYFMFSLVSISKVQLFRKNFWYRNILRQLDFLIQKIFINLGFERRFYFDDWTSPVVYLKLWPYIVT